MLNVSSNLKSICSGKNNELSLLNLSTSIGGEIDAELLEVFGVERDWIVMSWASITSKDPTTRSEEEVSIKE